MSAILSPGAVAPLPARQTRALSDASMQALRWTLVVALTAASAALLSWGTDTFKADVASQLAAGVQLQGFLPVSAMEEKDPFMQQKLDAKSEDLPAQF